MFDIVRSEMNSRVLSIRTFAVHIGDLETSRHPMAATFKGLVFVQLYALYEYAVRSCVQAMLSSIRNDAIEYRSLKANVLALVLDQKFDAASKAGPRRRWDARIALFQQACSACTTSEISDTVFPIDGTHYRPQQLETIWKIFGVEVPILPDQMHIGRILELVEHRNAIAHGRETAENIGRSYSHSEIDQRISDITAICSYILDVLQNHYISGKCVD